MLRRKIRTVLGVIIYVLGWALGIGALISSRGKIHLGANAWSPDAHQLVFEWQNDIYTIGADGRNPRKVNPYQGWIGEPTWSPRDNRIVYRSRPTRSDKYALFILDLDAHRETRITNNMSLDEFFPHWSPDGEYLGFYETSVYDGDPAEYGPGALVLSGPSGKISLQPRLADIGNISMTDDLEWSFDSKQIAFVGFSTVLPRNIYIMNVDGTGLQRLTNSNYDTFPAWSPDGHRVVFYSERDTDRNWIGSIYAIEVQNQAVKRLTNVIDRVTRMQWSPNGKQIAFVTSGNDYAAGKVYLMNDDGGNLQFITYADPDPLLSWSADGQYLALTGAYNLITVDAGTGQIALNYHPNFISFLPISLTEFLAVLFIIVGPIFTLPGTLGIEDWQQNGKHKRSMRFYMKAAFSGWVKFVAHSLGFLVATACIGTLLLILLLTAHT